jgi:hypothetical protein
MGGDDDDGGGGGGGGGGGFGSARGRRRTRADAEGAEEVVGEQCSPASRGREESSALVTADATWRAVQQVRGREGLRGWEARAAR